MLSDGQFERLKHELEREYQGAENAGRPLLLEGGLDWKAMSLSPKDMDFLDAKHNAAREIALCFGVPPMLLGIPGDNTYANYQEANRAFWRNTVLPRRAASAAALSQWLSPAFGGGVRLVVDTDRIEALAAGPRGAVGAGDDCAVSHAEREACGRRLCAGRGRGRVRVSSSPEVLKPATLIWTLRLPRRAYPHGSIQRHLACSSAQALDAA